MMVMLLVEMDAVIYVILRLAGHVKGDLLLLEMFVLKYVEMEYLLEESNVMMEI